MTIRAEDFLEELRGRVRRWGGAEWIADRVDGDDVVVLYRQHLLDRDEPDGLIEGARLNVHEFTEAGPNDLDGKAEVSVAAILEIVEPHELGTQVEVPWADGLIPRPRDVLWYGAAIDYATGTSR